MATKNIFDSSKTECEVVKIPSVKMNITFVLFFPYLTGCNLDILNLPLSHILLPIHAVCM